MFRTDLAPNSTALIEDDVTPVCPPFPALQVEHLQAHVADLTAARKASEAAVHRSQAELAAAREALRGADARLEALAGQLAERDASLGAMQVGHGVVLVSSIYYSRFDICCMA